jgi:hypothetical protein
MILLCFFVLVERKKAQVKIVNTMLPQAKGHIEAATA